MSLLKKTGKVTKETLSGIKGNLSAYNGKGSLTKEFKPAFTKQERDSSKDLEYAKQVIAGHADYNYSLNFSRDIQYNEMELYLYNHKGWICGYMDNDQTSADHVLMRCALREPKGLILGDCHISDMEKFNLTKFSTAPVIERIKGESLLGRQSFIDYFRNNFPTNLTYHKQYADYKINELDTTYRAKKFNANLTLAYYACYYDSKKVIFGSPQNLLHVEDLVINYTLQELQYTFYLTIQDYLKQAKEGHFLPPLNPAEMYETLRKIVQEGQTDKLFDKKCQYSAAVFKKIHKLYPDNILFMPHHLVPRTYEHITDSFCPEFDEIYRTKEFKKLLKETPSDSKTLEEVLEKTIILTHLIDKDFTSYLQMGHNPLKGMFGGKFAHFSDEKVTSLFTKINALYQSELEKLFFDDLKRVSDTFSAGRQWTRDYTDEITKCDKHSDEYKQLPKTEFLVDKFEKEKEMAFINRLLVAQIGINVKQKEMQGQNMNMIKLELRKYFSGVRTKENIDLYNQLYAEANAQLGLVKLPPTFRKFECVMNEAITQDLKDILGEDPQKVYDAAITKLTNQLSGIEQFVVKDGSEAEMKMQQNPTRLDLISKCDSFIFTPRKSAKEAKPNKSLQVTQKAAPTGEEEASSTTKDGETLLDLDEIEKIEDEGEKKKLRTIYEIQLALAEEDEERGGCVSYEQSIDVSVFKNKSIEELKKMDVEEVASYDCEVDAEGQYNVQSLYENQNELDRIEKEMTVTGKNGKFTSLDLAEASADKSFFHSFLKISPTLRKKDEIRAKKIEQALEQGQYLDDPIYVQILMTEPKFIRLREKFLKKYFTGEHQHGQKKNLLQKYARMEGDIVRNMDHDGVLYNADSPEGRHVGHLYQQFFDEIEKEGDGLEVEATERIGTDWRMDDDLEETGMDNLQEYLKDRMDELNNEKSIYFDVKANTSGQNTNSNAALSQDQFGLPKGRSIKSGQKKLKLL